MVRSTGFSPVYKDQSDTDFVHVMILKIFSQKEIVTKLAFFYKIPLVFAKFGS
jgi:hypothetical protein